MTETPLEESSCFHGDRSNDEQESQTRGFEPALMDSNMPLESIRMGRESKLEIFSLNPHRINKAHLIAHPFVSNFPNAIRPLLNKPQHAVIFQYASPKEEFQAMLNKTSVMRFIQSFFVPAFFLSMAAGAQIEFSKPKAEKPLPNPSILLAARDEMLTLVRQLLETREMPLDKEDCNPTNGECTFITKPVIFIKGIHTRSQLEHYCEVPAAAVRSWSKGRYVLRIQITPASTKTCQVGVYAKFEGMTEGATGSQWVPLVSKGAFEDKMLRCIQDRLQGGNCENIK